VTGQTIERKYTLHRIAKGDYLLPGNDGKTLWRIRKYEDGPSHGVDSMPRDREFWGVWKWIGPDRQWNLAEAHWNAWDLSNYDKREEAIQAALRAELPRPMPKPRSDSRPIGALLLDHAKVGE
jgi:hypothetical protein